MTVVHYVFSVRLHVFRRGSGAVVERLACNTSLYCTRRQDWNSRNTFILHVSISIGKVQDMNPWSMDPLHGPGPWTRSIDQVHQNMERVHGPSFMDWVHGSTIMDQVHGRSFMDWVHYHGLGSCGPPILLLGPSLLTHWGYGVVFLG